MRAARLSCRLWFAVLGVCFALLLQGCAHPISLNPDMSKVMTSSPLKIDRKVGLYIGDEDRKREVITPGGGGDKVSYYPYRDLEAGIYFALSEVFTNVSRVNGPADPKVKAGGLNFVISPAILTNSSSDSLLTWPPTRFSIELICRVTDGDGRPVTQVKASGEGRAEFSEFKGERALAANRATEQLLINLKTALSALSEARVAP
jgi:hypothetical protein